MDLSKCKTSLLEKVAQAVLVALFCICALAGTAAFAQKAYATDRADSINTVALYPISVNGGSWVHGTKGWWYKNANDTYPADTWAIIDKKVYHFDPLGWMSTNWLKFNNDWFWLGSDGALKTGWQKVKGLWYYLENNGAMITGKRSIENTTYFLTESGAMKTGWNLEDGRWFYYRPSGAMARGWVKSGTAWYYLNANGIMQTGKLTIDGKKYYFTGLGAMYTGWVNESAGWYYYGTSGAMYERQWKGDYYLGCAGIMETNAWVDSGKYYVGADGKWIPHKLVTVSANGYTYHTQDTCAQMKRIKSPQLISHSVAKSKGYSLCKNCQAKCDR